jgi:hypothetical protein
MPYMTAGKRDYKKEDAWDKTHSSKNGVTRGKARAMRNKARAMVAAKKGVTPTAINGDVGHKKAVSRGGKSVLANLFVQNATNNRSFSRNKDGSMKSERSKKGK